MAALGNAENGETAPRSTEADEALEAGGAGLREIVERC